MIKENGIFCSDCLPIMREIPDKKIDLIVTDPPYGINEMSDRNKWRAKSFGSRSFGKKNTTRKIIPPKDYGNFDWDRSIQSQEYFDELFRISKNQIIFGGNYFPLPPSPCWIVWDKDRSGDFADCELAWTSFTSAVRRFRYRWNGMLQEDMAHKEIRTHPTQKPLALMEWILQKYSKPGDLICDPFMGSGPVIEACVKLERRYIGIDAVPEYCAMAEARLQRVNNHRITDFEPVRPGAIAASLAGAGQQGGIRRV